MHFLIYLLACLCVVFTAFSAVAELLTEVITRAVKGLIFLTYALMR